MAAGSLTGGLFCWGTGWRQPYAGGVFWCALFGQLSLVVLGVLLVWPNIAHSFITTQSLASQRSTQFFSQLLHHFLGVLITSFQLSLAVTLRPRLLPNAAAGDDKNNVAASWKKILRELLPGITAGLLNVALYKVLEPWWHRARPLWPPDPEKNALLPWAAVACHQAHRFVAEFSVR
eukprot:SAG31_NODE_4412_length_3253_cov_1.928028_4_plen_177_part_00